MSLFDKKEKKTNMRYNQLGSAGVRVSEICLGTMVFTLDAKNDWGMPCSNEQTSHAILDRFVELGGNFIDTADAYGTSENVIGNWLASKPEGFRKSIIIATKFRSMTPPNGVNDFGTSRKHIYDAIERSLKNLRTNYIDLYQVHVPDDTTSLRETMRALNDLVRQGKVHYIGCSNFTSWQIQKANDIAEKENLEKFVTLQQQYSLLCRNVEWDTVDVCRNEGLGILPWSPLAGGWLSGKYDRSTENPEEGSRVAWSEKVGWSHTSWSTKSLEQTWKVLDELQTIAKELNVSVTAVALRWLIQRNGVTSIIIGPRTMEHFEQNIQAIDIHLSDEQMARLTKTSDTPLPYPFDIIQMTKQLDKT